MKNVFILTVLFALLLTACTTAGAPQEAEPFVLGAIPDQDPEKIQRQFDLLSTYLEDELGVPIEYKPVTDYAASVTAFRVGDLDMVWFGGLTGVQARLQVQDAQALVQRDIDENFHSVFIANAASGISPINNLPELEQLEGHTFTFGSESSTSGRLMPQYFLSQAGVSLSDFRGEPGFSGSHDATIDLVESGTYESGALNEQVWERRLADGNIDLAKVNLIWRTPPFHDYHWVIRSDITERYGDDFIDRVTQAFLQLDASIPEHKEILDLFGAEKFIITENDNYIQIETVAREIGKIE